LRLNQYVVDPFYTFVILHFDNNQVTRVIAMKINNNYANSASQFTKTIDV